MYEVWFINFKYLANEVFESLEEAIEYGKQKGFEFSVFLDNDLVGSATGVSLSWKEV